MGHKRGGPGTALLCPVAVLPLARCSALNPFLTAPLSYLFTPRSGRRSACLMYVLTYSLSCITKHSPLYWVLLLGRLLGGVSTSLLFSTFESWCAGGRRRTRQELPSTHCLCASKGRGDQAMENRGQLPARRSGSWQALAFLPLLGKQQPVACVHGPCRLVAEHLGRGFSPTLLGDVFSKSVFLGGGLMAILSGLIGRFESV